ncbi:MAG: PL29 family lyase N-terminal domain-containing protein [Candidatus Cryptobacteroides sp.]
MNASKLIKNNILSALAATIVALPLMTSCLPDVKAELDELKDRVENLESKFQTEITALKKLVEESVTVVSCKFSLADNCWKLELSDGTTLNIYDKVNVPDAVITYITDGGVKYWAVADSEGNVTALTDASGNRIPIVQGAPDPTVRETSDGYYEISFDGGKTWIRTGASGSTMFSGCNPVYPEDGSLPYVEITLSSGEVIRVAMKPEEKLLSFMDYLSGAEISEAYVPYGQELTLCPVMSEAVTDLLITVPAGWKVKDVWYEDYVEIRFTAPSVEALNAGFAEEEGNAKILAVAGNDMVETTTLFLTTNPVEYVLINNDVKITPRYGIPYGYFYGLCKESDFDAEMFAEYLADPSFESKAPFFHSYEGVSASLNELYGQECEDGYKYFLWMVPGLEKDGDIYVDPQTFVIGEVIKKVISLEVVGEASFNDANVLMRLFGSDFYYGGVTRKALFNPENLVKSLYDKIELPENGIYEGPASMFANHGQMRDILPGTDYVVWMVPGEEGKTSYLPEEFVSAEFKTSAIQTTGGSADISASDETVSFNSISVNLNAEGAAYIYYYFATDTQLSGYPTEESKVNFLLKNGNRVRNSEVSAAVTGLASGTTRTLWALAVDSEGKVGSLYDKSFTTKVITYTDAISFYFNETGIKIDQTTADIKVSLTAGSPAKFRYACLNTAGAEWTSTYKYSLSNLQEDMVVNPYKFTEIDVPSNGIIHLTGLKIDVEYVFALIAIDGEGLPTKAQKYTFATHMDLGNFVYKTVNGAENPVWKASCPKVTLYPDEYALIGDFGIVVFKIDVPEGMTAYWSAVHPDHWVHEKISDPKDKTIAIYQEQAIVESGKKQTYFGANTGWYLYITWKDAEGNFYEPLEVDTGFQGGWGV